MLLCVFVCEYVWIYLRERERERERESGRRERKDDYLENQADMFRLRSSLIRNTNK